MKLTLIKEDGMKRVMWMALAVLVIAAGSAQANCGKCGKGDVPKEVMEEMVNDRLDQMTTNLKLSAEQRAQVEAIMKDKMAKKQAIMDQKEAAMKALHEDFLVKLKGVLSAEQMKQWETKKDKCPDCKDGKLCEKCKLKKGNMKGNCPDCKDGKPCKKCKLKKGKMKGKCPYDHGSK